MQAFHLRHQAIYPGLLPGQASGGTLFDALFYVLFYALLNLRLQYVEIRLRLARFGFQGKQSLLNVLHTAT